MTTIVFLRNIIPSVFQLHGDRGKVSRQAFFNTLKYLVKISPQEADAIFVTADSENLGEISFGKTIFHTNYRESLLFCF